MPASLNLFLMLLLTAFLSGASRTVPLTDRDVTPTVHDVARRSTDTCADPTLADTFSQWYSGTFTAHNINLRSAFVNANTQNGAGPPFWSFQGPVFQAWATQQESTAPLFGLTAASGIDYIYRIGADANTAPIVSGFEAGSVLVAWVYATQVCGSVPLMELVFAAQTDHYYTTDPAEQAQLIASGWKNGGVVAFVLPLPTAA